MTYNLDWCLRRHTVPRNALSISFPELLQSHQKYAAEKKIKSITTKQSNFKSYQKSDDQIYSVFFLGSPDTTVSFMRLIKGGADRSFSIVGEFAVAIVVIVVGVGGSDILPESYCVHLEPERKNEFVEDYGRLEDSRVDIWPDSKKNSESFWWLVNEEDDGRQRVPLSSPSPLPPQS